MLGNLCLARRSAVREGNESLSATLGVNSSEGENRCQEEERRLVFL